MNTLIKAISFGLIMALSGASFASYNDSPFPYNENKYYNPNTNQQICTTTCNNVFNGQICTTQCL